MADGSYWHYRAIAWLSGLRHLLATSEPEPSFLACGTHTDSLEPELGSLASITRAGALLSGIMLHWFSGFLHSLASRASDRLTGMWQPLASTRQKQAFLCGLSTGTAKAYSSHSHIQRYESLSELYKQLATPMPWLKPQTGCCLWHPLTPTSHRYGLLPGVLWRDSALQHSLLNS